KNQDEWEISDAALFSPITASNTRGTGLFQSSFNQTADGGYNSFMFPRAGKMELRFGISHFSSTLPFEPRVLQSLPASGETDYMDGCNFRMSYRDTLFNESISSCNVTASIELFTRDFSTYEATTITYSKDVKLQLIRPSLQDKDGREFLHSSLKSCLKNSACASDECCFNGRCWRNKNVAQCKSDDTPIVGTLSVGARCSSDYQCASLCCDSRRGTCQVHDDTNADPVLCRKLINQSCVATSWCQQQELPQTLKIRTRVVDGVQSCVLRTYLRDVFAQCINDVCVPHPPFSDATLDPDNPDACVDAIDPAGVDISS
ncbi:MAG: hypothetical protein OXB84_06500, partial [Halobacteriovoraceae bacterium]|nr:hypothetical protein [Halobacteriovoraceae bacterium]